MEIGEKRNELPKRKELLIKSRRVNFILKYIIWQDDPIVKHQKSE
jgi:hypothetical protein